jgi:tRNA(fMet)-specific endonuclease VapC
MLDTNILSDLIRNPMGQVYQRLDEVGPQQICISIITAAELRFGCRKKASVKLTSRVETILQHIEILSFDEPADAEYARVRARLESKGLPIGPNDLLIAAHCLSVEAILVTANTHEFQRVSELTLQNWLEG